VVLHLLGVLNYMDHVIHTTAIWQGRKSERRQLYIFIVREKKHLKKDLGLIFTADMKWMLNSYRYQH